MSLLAESTSPNESSAPAAMLDVAGLSLEIRGRNGGSVYPFSDVDLTIAPGESVGVVGESGCGKTMLSRSIMRLVPGQLRPQLTGTAILNGVDMARAGTEQARLTRRHHASYVFQDPAAYLNPTMRVGRQVAEAGADPDVAELFASVGLPSNREFLRRYPHQLSGGMRQRVMIAMALANDPKVLIADEPTTALDVTVQAQILDLIRRLCLERGLALMLISHDLGVIAETCERVYVMYAGRVVEEGRTHDVLHRPFHPYTAALVAATNDINSPTAGLSGIDGAVPLLNKRHVACRFASRCPARHERCESEPDLAERAPGRRSRCWLEVADAPVEVPR